MAANGITVKPMRMGDIVSQTKVAGKYMPPSKRADGKIAPLVEKIDMSDKNFPTLGSAPVKVSNWGRHILPPILPKPEPEIQSKKREMMSDKIKEKIRLDAMAENERINLAETDPWKMTDEQLEQAGWVRLRMNSAREICIRGFSRGDDAFLPGFVSEADSGMSFDEYRHYKDVNDLMSMTLPPSNTPCDLSDD